MDENFRFYLPDAFPLKFGHDVSFSSEVLVTKTEEIIDDKCCNIQQNCINHLA